MPFISPVVDILFEVGPGAGDAVDLACPDHFGQRQPQLGAAHGAGHGQEHLPTLFQVMHVPLGGVDQRGGVEVAVVVLDKRADL